MYVPTILSGLKSAAQSRSSGDNTPDPLIQAAVAELVDPTSKDECYGAPMRSFLEAMAAAGPKLQGRTITLPTGLEMPDVDTVFQALEHKDTTVNESLEKALTAAAKNITTFIDGVIAAEQHLSGMDAHPSLGGGF